MSPAGAFSPAYAWRGKGVDVFEMAVIFISDTLALLGPPPSRRKTRRMPGDTSASGGHEMTISPIVTQSRMPGDTSPACARLRASGGHEIAIFTGAAQSPGAVGFQNAGFNRRFVSVSFKFTSVNAPQLCNNTPHDIFDHFINKMRRRRMK